LVCQGEIPISPTKKNGDGSEHIIVLGFAKDERRLATELIAIIPPQTKYGPPLATIGRELAKGLVVEDDGEDGVVLRESDIHSLEDPEGTFVPWLVGVVLEEPPLAILEGLCTRQGGVVDVGRSFDKDESLGE